MIDKIEYRRDIRDRESTCRRTRQERIKKKETGEGIEIRDRRWRARRGRREREMIDRDRQRGKIVRGRKTTRQHMTHHDT